jgi:histidine triad (HIT) family protein
VRERGRSDAELGGVSMKKHLAVDALEKASKGLEMPSESDAPFEVFLWSAGGEITSKELPQLAHLPTGTAIAEDTLDGLFRTVPAEDQARFQKLRQIIQQQLSGVKVFRVGEDPEKTVYIVGKTRDGKLAGLQTSVVET